MGLASLQFMTLFPFNLLGFPKSS